MGTRKMLERSPRELLHRVKEVLPCVKVPVWGWGLCRLKFSFEPCCGALCTPARWWQRWHLAAAPWPKLMGVCQGAVWD